MKNLQYISFLLIGLVSLSGCSDDPCDKFTAMVNRATVSQVIDQEHFDALLEKTLNDSTMVNCAFFQGSAITCKAVASAVQQITEAKRGHVTLDFECYQEALDPKNLNVKVYYERSGSMDGYIGKNSDFKDALFSMLVELDYHYGSSEFNWVDKSIVERENTEVESFINTLNKETVGLGRSGDTYLNDILEMILDDLEAKDMGILISDCIYSIDGTQTERLLNREQHLTQKVFLDRLKKGDLSCAVLRMEAPFTGWYYDKRGTNAHDVSLNNVLRPYFIWFFGQPEVLEDVFAKVKLENLTGYRNAYFLEWYQTPRPIDYSVMMSTERIGRFKPDRNMSDTKVIKGITGVESGKRDTLEGLFQFSVAMDLSSLTSTPDYLSDKSNYLVDEDFEIMEVKTFSDREIEVADRPLADGMNYTHLITVRTDERPAYLKELNIVLKRQVPGWVEKYSTLDDLNTDKRKEVQDKTFGLSYLIAGVNDAYKLHYRGNEYQIHLRVTIKKD